MFWDSDGESSSDDFHRPTQVDNDSDDDQPLVRPGRGPPKVVEALEHDLCEQCLDPGTTESSSSVLASMIPTTVPMSSSDVREVHRGATTVLARVVFVPGSPDATPDSQGAPSSGSLFLQMNLHLQTRVRNPFELGDDRAQQQILSMGYNTMPLTPRLPVTMGLCTTTIAVSQKFIQLVSLCPIKQNENLCWSRWGVARHVQHKILMSTR